MAFSGCDMTDQTVLYHLDDRGVAWVTLNRPDKRNAFGGPVIAALTEALEQARNAPGCRALVVSGNGKHFSAGADLDYMRQSAQLSEAQNIDDARTLARLMDTLDRFPAPTIARVQGAAFGGALGLVSCSDIVLAAEDARFCLSETRLGLAPSTIGPYVVRAMGARQARRYFLSAEEIDVHRAQALNLVHQVVPGEGLDEAVNAMLARLLKNGPQAQAACKELIARIGQNQPDDGLMDFTARQIARLRTGDEAQEGLAAFLEKRSASWVEGGLE